MGYDIHGSGQVRIAADKVQAAYDALQDAIIENGSYEDLPDRAELPIAKRLAALADDVTECFYCASTDAGEVTIEPIDDSFRRVSEEEWVFEALSQYADADSEITFTGEDSYQWKWSFETGKLVEVDSHQVWGRDGRAPHIAGEVEDLIYDSGTGKIRVHEDPQAVLDQIEEILRKNGFGPFAGLGALDILAKAAE